MNSRAVSPGRDVLVATLDDLKQRERIVVDIGGSEVGLYYFQGKVRAWWNSCPHAGGPVCQGKTMPRTTQGVKADGRSAGPQFSKTERNIVCPWHGYEFDILTGAHPAAPFVRLRPVEVRVADGNVIVTV